MSFKTEMLTGFGFKSAQEFHGHVLDIVAPAVDGYDDIIALKFTCVQVTEIRNEISLYLPVRIRFADGRLARRIVYNGEWHLKLEAGNGSDMGVRCIFFNTCTAA